MTAPPDYARSYPSDFQYRPDAASSASQTASNVAPPPPPWSSLSSTLSSDPAITLASAYGQHITQQGKEQLGRFVSVSKLKRYFDLDNRYVGKKLLLLVFPFFHQDWSVSLHGHDDVMSPKQNINAVDLYIPTLAVITYIFVSGCVLGVQNRFTPEQLGLLSSATLAWLLIENLVITGTRYAMVMSDTLSFLDTLAFSGYKYVGMIACLAAFLIGGKSVYIYVLCYCSLAVSFFLARSVKVHVNDGNSYEEGKKRKTYLLLYISLTQPLIMWWLTRSLTSYTPRLPHDPADYDL